MIFIPKRVEKGWGFEFWLANSDLYCGKLLHFNKGKKCSLHYHLLKDETFYVANGLIVLRRSFGTGVFSISDTLAAGSIVHIERNTRHQIIALEDSDIYEFSTEHFEEDSYRTEPGDSQVGH